MSLVFIAPNQNMQRWKDAVLAIAPTLDIAVWPDVPDTKRVQFAVTWNHPAHVLEQYPNLQAVSSLGAGVDHILSDESIPDHVSVCRIISPSLVQQMKVYIFNAIFNYQRNTQGYIEQQRQGVWKEWPHKKARNIPVGIMGLGALGRPIASGLAGFGYEVAGWARHKKDIAGIQVFTTPNGFDPFLKRTKILVCLLPLTDQTRGLVDLEVFKKIKHPGYFINVARGQHLVEEDLIYALDKGWLEGACLDVFADEPLPETHPFWNRSNIMITPHVSSITQPQETAGQIVDNYKRVLSGMKLNNTVDKEKGY